MAQQVQILLIDDIDGGEAVETVSFGLDGTNYEIDVNEANAAALRGAIAEYAQHGRRLSRNGKSRSGATLTPVRVSGPAKHSAQEIRDWARTNGIEVSERGRVPKEVRDQFEAAVG